MVNGTLPNTAQTAFDRSYHALNVLLHSLVCASLVFLLRELAFSGSQIIVASSIFSVHPVHVEVIAGIVSRADLLSGLLYLWSMWFYLRGLRANSNRHSMLHRTTAYLLWLAATLSKEVGFTGLAGFVLAELLFIKRPQSGAAPWPFYRLQSARTVGHIMLAFVVALTFMHFRLALHNGAPLYQWTQMENQFSLMPNSLPRILSILNTHAVYLGLLVWPASLSFDHGFATLPVIENLVDVRNIPWALVYVAFCLFVMVCVMKKKRRALWGAGIAVASFLPASNLFLFVGTEVAERLLYIPTIGIAVSAAALIDGDAVVAQPLRALARILPGKCGQPLERGKVNATVQVHKSGWLLCFTFCAVVMGFALRSFSRGEDWRTELGLYQAGVKTHPRSMKALNNYANLMMNKGGSDNLEVAQSLLERAIAIAPLPPAQHNLGLTLKAMGNTTGALHLFWHAVSNRKTAPCTCYMDLAEMYLNDVRALDSKSRPGTSSALLAIEPAEARQFWEDSRHQHVNVSQGSAERSINMLKALVEHASSCSSRTNRLAMLRAYTSSLLGAPSWALQEASHALVMAASDPERAQAESLAGLLSMELTDQTAAEKHLQAATQLQPTEAAHYTNLGILFLQTGNLPKAEAAQRRALELSSSATSRSAVLNNLMETLFIDGNFQGIIELASVYSEVHTSQILKQRVVFASEALAFVNRVLQ